MGNGSDKKEVPELRQYEQTQWILDYLQSHSPKEGSKFRHTYMIGTTKVCLSTWMNVIGIKQSRCENHKKV